MNRVDVVGIGEPMALLEHDAGDLAVGGTFTLRLAGAEMNLLIGVRRQGFRAALATAVGDDPFGKLMVETLTGEGLDVSEIDTDAASPTGLFVKRVTSGEERQVWYYRDGSAASLYRRAPGPVFDRLDPRMFVLSGLTLGLGGDGGMGDTAVAWLTEAHRRGISVVFDANLRSGIWAGVKAAEQFRELVDRFDVVLAGYEELAELFGEDEVEMVAAEVVGRGARAVVVKLGAEGAIVVDGTTVARIPSRTAARVLDPVGAGDAFAAGVVTGLLRGDDLVSAAHRGAVLGAEVVAHRGDWEGLPDKHRTEELLAAPVPSIGRP